MLRTRILTCAAAGLLAGCTVGPHYKAPDQKMPATFGSAEGTVETAEALDRWWIVFKDPELESLVDRALKITVTSKWLFREFGRHGPSARWRQEP